jgi:hypothetical protein
MSAGPLAALSILERLSNELCVEAPLGWLVLIALAVAGAARFAALLQL